MTKRANNRGTKAVHPSERPIIPRPTAVTKRRPIRPIDRQPMRHWLTEKLKSGDFSKQLKWVEEGQTFAVTWCHAARHGWNMSDHAPLFEAWARHTGIYLHQLNLSFNRSCYFNIFIHLIVVIITFSIITYFLFKKYLS